MVLVPSDNLLVPASSLQVACMGRMQPRRGVHTWSAAVRVAHARLCHVPGLQCPCPD